MTLEIPSIDTLKKRFSLPKPWDTIVVFLLNILLTIPVFIIAHQNFIDLNWNYHLDRILLFLVILTLFQLLLQLVKTVLILVIFLYLLILFYGTVIGEYGFQRVFEDYRYMIYAMKENPNPQDIIIARLLPFPNKTKIKKAVDYSNPKVRNFALKATTKHFKDAKNYANHRVLLQCFAVFKEIRNNWNYVNDPIGAEYIAFASESLTHFSGDCDDHAILMAAAIKAIGGTPRIIHTGGHMYPEMLIGTQKDFETATFIIKEIAFPKESHKQPIHYHIDERNQIWLNLDYTATYPGGRFMSEEILGALTF